MTVQTEQLKVVVWGRRNGVIPPVRHQQNPPANPRIEWTFWGDSATLGVTKSLWRGARCLQRISAHLSHFRRSSGLPPQDNFDGHGATRWVAYGSL